MYLLGVEPFYLLASKGYLRQTFLLHLGQQGFVLIYPEFVLVLTKKPLPYQALLLPIK